MFKWSQFLLLVLALIVGLLVGRMKFEKAPAKTKQVEKLTVGESMPQSTPEIFMPFPEKAATTSYDKTESILHFLNRDDYEAYLKSLRSRGLQPLGKLPALLVLKLSPEMIQLVDPDEFGAERSYNYPIRQPRPPAQVFPGAMAELFAYGMTAQDISGGGLVGKGEGVRIAILDSGIATHSQFHDTSIETYD